MAGGTGLFVLFARFLNNRCQKAPQSNLGGFCMCRPAFAA